MFTGIISHIGSVESITQSGDWMFVVRVPDFTGSMLIGASVACSGACLTVTRKTAESFTVQVSAETLSKTTLGGWKKGTRLNLERALKVGDELGGHFVSGHVDGLATVESVKDAGESKEFWFAAPEPLSRFIAPKGSVTLDGVSLTVNQVVGDGFSVNIIPHTRAHTTLGERKVTDRVNLEIDLIARYLERLR